MNSYIATRKKAYWVEETMYIEAKSVKEAKHTFYNDFFVTGHTLPDRMPCEVEVAVLQPVANQLDESVKISASPWRERRGY